MTTMDWIGLGMGFQIMVWLLTIEWRLRIHQRGLSVILDLEAGRCGVPKRRVRDLQQRDYDQMQDQVD